MAPVVSKLPFLDHFLNAYMHQDWDEHGETLADLMQLYVGDVSPSEASELALDIENFIKSEGDELDRSYYQRYPNGVAPFGWDMTVEQWLRHIQKLVLTSRPHR